jgi:hypothetical protein
MVAFSIPYENEVLLKVVRAASMVRSPLMRAYSWRNFTPS